MNTNTIKVKKGGIDSIVAFIVVLLPLVYVLIYMVATLYHFGVQMYINQVVKETLVMASTYGGYTGKMEEYLKTKAAAAIGAGTDIDNGVTLKFYVVEFYENGTISNTKTGSSVNRDRDTGKITYLSTDNTTENSRNNKNGKWVSLKKGDLLGLYVESVEPSLLGTVSKFNIFGAQDSDSNILKYSAYREEIIRNDSK